MRVKADGKRVVLDLTLGEWLSLVLAFRRVQQDAQSDQAEESLNEPLQKDADTLWKLEEAVAKSLSASRGRQ